MCREIRSERLSVKVNAARIRQAASWPGMRGREKERGRDARRKEIGGGVRVKATERRTKWEMEGGR